MAFDTTLAARQCDGRGLGLAIALAMPIVWFTMRQPAAALASESRGSTAGVAVQRVRHGFLVGQVALAFALLSGAGLLALSLREVLCDLAGVPGRERDERADLVAGSPVSRHCGAGRRSSSG